MIDPLLRQFAAKHPVEFASALNYQPVAELIGLFEVLDPELAAPIAANLGSLKLHDTLARLPDAVTGRLLLACDQTCLVAILSHLPDERYSGIIESANEDARSNLERILDMSMTTLSALATTEFILVNATSTCDEVIQLLQDKDDLGREIIIVTDSNGTYRGILRPLSLVPKVNARRLVHELMDHVEPLLSLMPINSAIDAKQWHHFATLPVVDHALKVVGVVSNEKLHTAAHAHKQDTLGLDEVLAQAAIGYLEVCTDLLDIGIGRRN